MVVGDFPLAKKIAVVTGGGSGINLAFVRLAFKSNAKVLIADLRLTAEAEALVKESSGNVAYTTCDVTKWADLERLPAEVEKAFGQGAVADVWVPGAGVFEPKWSSFIYDTETDGYKAMQINAEHPIKLTRVAMRSALGANKPCVVLITASKAGLKGIYGSALYCASKHAVVGFVRSMAQADADENVKIVAICPGMVATPLWTGEEAKHVATQFSYSEERANTPEEVAQAMKEMVEDGKYGGGALLAMSKDNMRENIKDSAFVPRNDAERAWWDETHAPAREVFRKERGAVS